MDLFVLVVPFETKSQICDLIGAPAYYCKATVQLENSIFVQVHSLADRILRASAALIWTKKSTELGSQDKTVVSFAALMVT